jgi:DNA processing protein
VPDHPPLLFVKGNLALLQTQMVAVVGTRNITNYGQAVTSKITRELIEAGITICSGFMYGVDACAHRTAITNHGKTVAVLGYGFDHLFPAHFHSFFDEMLETGNTFVTEYAPFVQPTQGTFPQRNRIIAGLSLGVVVTEAAGKSGSHITAEAAVEYDRSVYAVPGPITNPYTEGTKALINLGALCISSGQEVLIDLKIAPQEVSPKTASKKLNSDLQPLYQLLTHQSHSLTELANLTRQPTTQLLANLAQLELQKVIVRSHGQWLINSS